MSDFECLQSYARENSQAAFAALVARHVDLVYSAALRQVRSPDLAEEVAQSVFLDLSRSAHRLADREPGRTAPAQPLAAWLYVVTRRTAVDVIRRESRRQTRERTAAEFAAMKETPPHAWSHVERSLDDAMDTLNDTERSAIVLRFFENHSLREVGAALGISEDTAQKRVSRALDQLRTFFAGRGVAVTATSLASELSAHAIQAAPVGLGATISTAAALSGTAGATAAIEATKTIAMTTFQKSVVAATFALTIGAGVFEARVAFNQRAELNDLQQRTDLVVADMRNARLGYERTQRALETTRAKLAALRTDAPISAGDEALASAMTAWFGRVGIIKQTLAEHPELSIPELALLDEKYWFSFVQDAQLETDGQIRDALARIRGSAESSATRGIASALRVYLAAHDGQLPTQTSELAALFKPPVDPSLLQRYRITQSGKASEVSARDRNSFIVEQSPVDADRDSLWRIGVNSGYSSEGAAAFAVRQAQREFAAANNGARATSSTELLPYLKWPLSAAKLQELMPRAPAASR